MNREQILIVRDVFLNSIGGIVVGYLPWLFLTLLMQGNVSDVVGIIGVISAIGIGNLFPLKVFHQRMEQLPNGRGATILFTLLIAVGIPIAWFLLPDVQTTTNSLEYALVIAARVLIIAAFPTVGAALNMIRMTPSGFKRSGQERESANGRK